jgi:hypothetical protein
MNEPEAHVAKLPRIIIIESTALFQLGWQLEHVDFSDLLQWRKLLKSDIAVSRVSWLEFLRERKKQVAESLVRVRQLRSSLEKLGQDATGLKTIEERLAELDETLVSVFEEKLSKLGIQILPLANTDLESLLQMAVENVPPFEQSNEKGFRDSLIMFSILDVLRGHPELNALIVSNDKLFTLGILAKQGDYGTVVNVVTDLKEAVAYISGFVSQVVRALRSKEKQEAKELLLKYRPEIVKAVSEIRELSYFDLPSAAVSGGHVEQVLSLKFDDVDSATWKNHTEDSATILFSLKCTLTAIVSPPIWEFLNNRIPIGGGSTLLTPRNQDSRKAQMEKTVFGVAEFVIKDGETKLVRIQIDTKLPVEDLVILTRKD